jgi:hypothetical protein
MGIDIRTAADVNQQNEALNTPPRLSPRSSFAVKWEGDAYQNNPYVATGTQEAARHVGLRNVQSVETFHCGGRTHLHIQFSDGERASYTFSGRNETTGVLKLVGRVPLSEERIVAQECETAPGKWRNTAIRVLVQDILETGALRVACVKVSSTSVECLLSAEERPMFLDGMRMPTMRLGAKHM